MVCQKCSATFPIEMVIDGKMRMLGSRKYCLECSPWGMHNTRTLQADVPPGERMCSKCRTTKVLASFYKYKNGEPHGWCKNCQGQDTIRRQRQFKLDAIGYKGGVCVDCHTMPHQAAMEFHHLDPSKKDFSISWTKHFKMSPTVIEELDKCVLLCKNCHAIRHASGGPTGT